MANILDITSALSSVPPFPQIASEVLHALHDSHAHAQRIVGLVEKDVALTTAVLKLSNSGLYGRRRSIGSVRGALLALGADTFGQTVMRASVKNYLNPSMPAADLNRCWAHSVACSEISRILASSLNCCPDVAVSAGLLHDIGRFGLASVAPAKHNQLLNGEAYVDVLDTERQLFGLDHTEVGRLLAEQFKLPDAVQLCAGRHHDTYSDEEPDIRIIVSISCSIASAVGFQVVPPSVPKSLAEVIAAAPASLREHISPDIETWTLALLHAFGSN